MGKKKNSNKSAAAAPAVKHNDRWSSIELGEAKSAGIFILSSKLLFKDYDFQILENGRHFRKFSVKYSTD